MTPSPPSLRPTVTPAGALTVHIPSSAALSPQRLWSRVRSQLRLSAQADTPDTKVLTLSHHSLHLSGRTIPLESIQSITTDRRLSVVLSDERLLLPATLSSQESAWLRGTLKLYRARRLAALRLIQHLSRRVPD